MESVFIPIPVTEVTEADEKPSRTYKLDLDKRRIVGEVDGLEAVNQAIRKAIITPRFKCLIYSNQYGSEVEEMIISKDATPELIEASVPGFVKDALKPDTRILKVYDFAFKFKGEGAFIFFRADTIFGETEFEEVI